MRIKSLLLSVTALLALSQSTLTAFAGTLTPQKDTSTGLIGYADEKGKWKIQPTYAVAYNFFSTTPKGNKWAWVMDTDSLYSIINEKGQPVIANKYAAVSQYSEISPNVCIATTQATSTSPYRLLIYIKGKEVKEETTPYSEINWLVNENDRAIFALGHNGTWQQLSINKSSGATNVTPLNGFGIYGDAMIVKNGDSYQPYFEGNDKVIKDGKYLIYHKKDRSYNLLSAIMIDPETGAWASAKNYVQIAESTDGKKKGLFKNNSDKIALPPIYEDIVYAQGAKSLYMIQKDGKTGVANYQGEILLPLEYENLKHIGNNQFYCKKNDKWGLVQVSHKENKAIIPCEYDQLTQDKGGFFKARKGDKWGKLSPSGKVLVDVEYKDVEYDGGGTFYKVTYDDGSTRILNADNNKLMPQSIAHTTYNIQSVGVIAKNADGKYGVYSPEGAVIIAPTYKEIYPLKGYKDMYMFKNSDSQFTIMYPNNGKLVTAVPMGHFTTYLRSGEDTEFIVGKKGNQMAAFCGRGKKLTPFHVANAVHFAGSKIYLVYENGSTGTVYCYGLDGNYYGKYSGGAYGTANFIRQTQYK